MAATHSGRNDSSHDLASLSPIGVDPREQDAVSYAESDPPNLTLILACVDALESRAREDRGCEGEIESSLCEIPLSLPGIRREAHRLIYARIYTRATPVQSSNDRAHLQSGPNGA